jgi:cell division septal protein FtsQ
MSRHFKTKYLQKQRQRHIRRLFGVFCLFSVIGCFVYLVLFSGAFQIKDIKIIGAKRVPESLVKKEIETLIGGKSVLPINNNLVFVDITNIKKIFLADISQVHVSKNFFTRTLNVYVTEKSPIARITFEADADSAFMEGSSNTYLSSEGKIFKSNLLKNEKLVNIKIKNQNTNNLNQI